MIDKGSCYKAFALGDASGNLGIKHIRTKPSTPKTNGKAEASSKPPFGNGLTPEIAPTGARGAADLAAQLAPAPWWYKISTPISRIGLT